MTALTTHAVVAHTSRREMAEALAELVGARVFWDDGSLGEQVNHQRALAWLATRRTPWVTLLEDDAAPCTGYLEREAEALRTAPLPGIVSEYLGTGRWAGLGTSGEQKVRALVERADRERSPWITAGALWHAVAIALPRRWATPLHAHLAGASLPTDLGVTTWARRVGAPVHYTHPSLVDHHDGPTVVAHPDRQPRTQPRRAWRVAGAPEVHGEQPAQPAQGERSPQA